MLLRRRYRALVAFAVIFLIALYNFGSSRGSWRHVRVEHPEGEEHGHGRPHARPVVWAPRPQVADETKKLDLLIPVAETPQSQRRPPAITPIPRPSDKAPQTQDLDATAQSSTSTSTSTAKPKPPHWSKQAERFPVPAGELLSLPTGKPKPIPRIQHAFSKRESRTDRAERLAKLAEIKSVFLKSWDGYRDFAWRQDELSPSSGKFRNPFAGWGATLVDSLDTLWIMGLREEFEEAVKAVEKIDFSTAKRLDIPVFETTIRYLGGLLAAYDVSGHKYPILLDKAVELAEVLMSVFDTRNRMPITYYRWMLPAHAQPEQAGDNVVLAEIGSLSMEFTRLAQVTGEVRYYDAVARITELLEEFQGRTRLGGMWPTQFDASGCRVMEPVVEEVESSSSAVVSTEKPLATEGAEVATKTILDSADAASKPLDPSKPVDVQAESPSSSAANADAQLRRRQFQEDDVPAYEELTTSTEEPTPTSTGGSSSTSSSSIPTSTGLVCEPQLFNSSTGSGMEEYTLGGMSDSTYEYLPKQYLLLGGLVSKYRSMYESAIDIVKAHLLFRPMVPDNADILFSGKLYVPETPEEDWPKSKKGTLEPENAHLTCFAGGMFAMGAKIFNRPDELKIAEKLTKGCIWSYEMTPTGIMPEAFLAVPCKNMEKCDWDEKRYGDILDPNADTRITYYEQSLQRYKEDMVSASSQYAAEMAAWTAGPGSTARGAAGARDFVREAEAKATPAPAPTPQKVVETIDDDDDSYSRGLKLKKRQLRDEDDAANADDEASKPNPLRKTNTVPKWRPPARNPSLQRGSALNAPNINGHAPDSDELVISGQSRPGRANKDRMVAPKLPVDSNQVEADTGAGLPPTRVIVEDDEYDATGETETATATEDYTSTPEPPVFPAVYSPFPPQSHEEAVQQRLRNDRLPKGVTSIPRRSYILRYVVFPNKPIQARH